MGEVLILAKESGEIRRGGDKKSSSDGSSLKLSDLGITHDQSSITQQLARLPDDEFEERIALQGIYLGEFPR